MLRLVTRKAETWVPALLLLATVAIAMVEAHPPRPADELIYFTAAADFPDVPLTHHHLRYGLLLPVRLVIEALGEDRAAYFAAASLGAIALVLGTYWLGRAFFNVFIGGIAAAVVLVLWPVRRRLGDLLPDTLATGLTAIAIASIVHAMRKEAEGRRDMWTSVLLVLAGVCLGWACLTRETAIFLIPIAGLALLTYRAKLRSWLLVGLPVAVAVGAESALSAAVFGDPMARWNVGAAHAPLEMGGESQALVATLLRLPSHLAQSVDAAVSIPLLLVLVVGAFIVRHKGVWILAAWVGLYWLALTLAGGLVSPDHPRINLRIERYWFPLLPPLVVGGLGTAWLLVDRYWRFRPLGRRALAVVLIIGAAIVMSASLAATGSHSERRQLSASRDLDSFSQRLSNGYAHATVIWTDWRTAMLLPLYSRTRFGRSLWNGEIRTLAPDSQPRRGDIIVLNSFQGTDRWCPACRRAAAEAIGGRVPLEWKSLHAGAGPLDEYRVEGS